MRHVIAIVLLSVFAAAGSATAATLLVEGTGWQSDRHLVLAVSEPLHYRVSTRTDPNRLVIDLDGAIASEFASYSLSRPGVAETVRAGVVEDGWTRLVFELSAPLKLDAAALTGDARLELRFDPTDQAEFDRTATTDAPPKDSDRRLRIAIDAGHGGVDPGAIRDGIEEKTLVLEFAESLAALIAQSSDLAVIMTRDSDVFVSLADRMTIARAGGADLLISIHANTVALGDAQGAAVFTLSETASDAASAQLAELENRADLAAGLEFASADDDVTTMLYTMAAEVTNARSRKLGEALLTSLAGEVGVVRDTPLYSGFRVLSAPDIPSVLLELGFMSNTRDRARMMTPEWRDRAAVAVLQAIRTWAHDNVVGFP